MKQEVEWRDEFRIGVKIVDEAHRKLFTIVRRILVLTEDMEKNKYACVEGIKYFKSYALEHFQQEEEYMRSINYPGYAGHKWIHEKMRDRTLPALELELKRSDYSQRSVERFVDFCVKWLTKHIMIEDKAIIRKARPRAALQTDRVRKPDSGKEGASKAPQPKRQVPQQAEDSDKPRAST